MAPSGRRRAKRSLGQNFLVDPNLQRKIVEALGAGLEDEVVEIGPGRGALTRHLVGTVGGLVLVELDTDLAQDLSAEYADTPHVRVVSGDVLDVALQDHIGAWDRCRVIGNIPYNVTSPIIFKLLARPRPLEIVLMVQEEVAARMAAPPGTKAYGALSVGVRSVADVERLFGVSRQAFRPVPGVESAVVRIRPHAPPRLSASEEVQLRRVVRACFQWRRKQLGKILRSHPDLSVGEEVAAEAVRRAEASPLDRPETLSPEAFAALASALP